MNALLTDLYELTMAAGYFEAGMHRDIATFEMSIRRLPKNRGFVLACGIPQAVEYLRNLRFAREEIDYLRSLQQLARVRPEFFDFLAELRFTGEVRAMAEGTPVFPGEPLMTVRAPIVEAQIAETYLLSIVAFQSMVATKAARVVAAAEGRGVVEFGTRRAHSPEAGVLAGRAAYIGGCIGTSNVLTGFRYGVPVYGTAAHSWVQAFPSEMESYRRLQMLLGEGTIYLIDTYNTVEGARKAAALGRPLWGVRLDSGDLAELSREVRGILDRAGLTDARIMASGDLDEYRIRALVRDGAPIDAFGVGTELATSADAPSLPAVYKLVEIETNGRTRYTIKLSTDKLVMPGGKQIWRYADRDCITRWDERIEDGEARPLVNRIMAAGELTGPLPDERAAREYAATSVAGLPEGCRIHEQPQAFGVEYSASMRRLLEEVRRGI